MPPTKYWAKVGAENNAINYHYREVYLAGLEAEGWNIIIEQPDPDSKESKAAWLERKEIEQESKLEENQSVDQAPDLTINEAKKIDRSPTQTPGEVAALTKHKIKQKYGVEEVSVKLIEADQDKLYLALRLRYWLTIGREYLKDNDRNLIKKQLERNQGKFFVPDFNNSSTIFKVRVLEMLNSYLSAINKPDSEWSNKSPELKKLKKYILQNLVQFNQVLKCGVAKSDSPITVLQKILKVIGQKLTYLRNERDGKKRLRIYGGVVSRFGELHHLEDEILLCWLRKEKQADLERDKPCPIKDGDIFSSGAA